MQQFSRLLLDHHGFEMLPALFHFLKNVDFPVQKV